MIEVRVARPGDAADVQQLFEQPLGGAWQLATRFPQGLSAGLATLGERITVVVAADVHGVLASGVRAVRPVWWEGRATRLGYRALLRCHARLPLLARPGVLVRCQALLTADRRQDELPWDLTAILDTNRTARRLLERGLPGAPAYHRIATQVTQILAARELARQPIDGVRPAQVADLPAIARLVRGLVCGDSGLRPRSATAGAGSDADADADADGWWVMDRGAGPSGCVRLADQRASRDWELVATPQVPRWSSALIDWWRARTQRAPLPHPGSLAAVYLDGLRAADPAQARSLASAAAHAALATGALRILHGWTMGDPLVPQLPGGDRVLTNWYAVGAPVDGTGPFHQELATL